MAHPALQGLVLRVARRHGLAQLRLEIQIELVEQLVLRVEVGEQRAFGDARQLRDLGRRRAHPLFRDHRNGGCQNRVAFVFALGTGHGGAGNN